MKPTYLLLSTLIFICACSQPSKQKEAKAKSNSITALNKMDALEKIFNNDNWMKIVDKDTSYYNFSRNQSVTKIYYYKMDKGDSVNTKISQIKISNDSLVWNNYDSVNLLLADINEKKASWKNPGKNTDGQNDVTFEKQSEKTIKVTLPGNRKYLLIRTLPLSSFLVRSQYDYIHGSRLAFNDTEFVNKK